jgi:hypothetical protein
MLNRQPRASTSRSYKSGREPNDLRAPGVTLGAKLASYVTHPGRSPGLAGRLISRMIESEYLLASGWVGCGRRVGGCLGAHRSAANVSLRYLPGRIQHGLARLGSRHADPVQLHSPAVACGLGSDMPDVPGRVRDGWAHSRHLILRACSPYRGTSACHNWTHERPRSNLAERGTPSAVTGFAGMRVGGGRAPDHFGRRGRRCRSQRAP